MQGCCSDHRLQACSHLRVSPGIRPRHSGKCSESFDTIVGLGRSRGWYRREIKWAQLKGNDGGPSLCGCRINQSILGETACLLSVFLLSSFGFYARGERGALTINGELGLAGIRPLSRRRCLADRPEALEHHIQHLCRIAFPPVRRAEDFHLAGALIACRLHR